MSARIGMGLIGSITLGVALSGCQPTKTVAQPQNQLAPITTLTVLEPSKPAGTPKSFADRYQHAPTESDNSLLGFVYQNRTLAVIKDGEILNIRFESDSSEADEFAAYSFRPSNSMLGQTSESRYGGFAVSEVGEYAGIVYFYDTIGLNSTEKLLSMYLGQTHFSVDGQYSFIREGDSPTVRVGPESSLTKLSKGSTVSSSMRNTYCRGSFGRIILESDGTQIDGVTLKPIKFPTELATSLTPIWIDEGHLLAMKSGKCVDYGRFPNVPVISAKNEAFEYSPWWGELGPDKQNLKISSIFRGGPTYRILSKQPISIHWQFYGLRALIVYTGDHETAEIYDLDAGKLALTIKFGNGDIVLFTPDYKYWGDEELAAKLGLKKENSKRDEVMKVVDHLFQKSLKSEDDLRMEIYDAIEKQKKNPEK